jgi:hypothetical protein
MVTRTFLVVNTLPLGLGFEAQQVLAIQDASQESGEILGELELLFTVQLPAMGKRRVLRIGLQGGHYSLTVRTELNLASSDGTRLLSLPELIWPPNSIPLARRICVIDEHRPFLVLDPDALRARLLQRDVTSKSGERP